MNKLNDTELCNINGGSITGTLVNAVVEGFKFFYNIGIELGNTIRKLTVENNC